jgi:tRNA dimethylallyltransferase
VAEEDIQMRGRLPILVGGTAMYIKALVDGLSEELPVSDTVRAELAAEAGRRGAARLHAEELMQVDPESAARIHPNDERRVIRALEVYRMTGQPMSKLQTQWRVDGDTHYRMIGLTMPREQLYARIDARVHAMMDAGLVAEVRRVQALGIQRNASAAGAIGYAEILAYLAGAHDRDRAVELIQRNTRRFAKHQLTWFRGDARIAWFDVNAYPSVDMVADAVESFLVAGGPTAEPPPRLT